MAVLLMGVRCYELVLVQQHLHIVAVLEIEWSDFKRKFGTSKTAEAKVFHHLE